ncbi:MAG: redox-sensing transcriptional repressor Rex [Clostridia bacterium]|nr:redox-sensing transcriptional repressor Rex [Clostridia bacterium]
MSDFDKRDTVVSPAVVKRLPRYYRYLRMLFIENKLRISSSELSELMGVTSSQIRQDLNCFGGFGQQGYGYNVTYLYGKISEILGVNENYTAIIIGAGKLGQALASSPLFTKRGVEVVALFDLDPEKIGKTVDDRPILPIEELEGFCKKHKVDIAVLTLTATSASEMRQRLENIDIPGIWNFTSVEISSKKSIVENVHLGDSLMTLCYEMRKGTK